MCEDGRKANDDDDNGNDEYVMGVWDFFFFFSISSHNFRSFFAAWIHIRSSSFHADCVSIRIGSNWVISSR